LTIETKFGVPEKHRVKVADILYDSFEHKFRICFGAKNKFLPFASSCLRDDRNFVAFEDGIPVGVAGLIFSGKTFLEANLYHTVRAYGLEAVRIGIFALPFIINTVPKTDVFLDVLAVSADERGKGIGSKLVQGVIDYARSNGFYRVTLTVTETNHKARRLYERIGFKATRDRKIPYPFSSIMGFGSVTEMVYNL
jgi:ribosomal protein S18 acetylase RimI-like enzyme